jgi:2-phosphoglycerate kinase
MDNWVEDTLNRACRFPESPVYIWILGGSFQGKSLIAASLSVRLGIPHVINTDLLRNVIRSQHNPPPDWLGTSTYLLSELALGRQFEAVSDLLQTVLSISRRRGESVIVEGMHVSLPLLRAEAARADTFVVGVDNMADYETRIRIKVRLTRQKGRLDRYQDHSQRVQAIHQELLDRVSAVGGQIVTFHEMKSAIEMIERQAAERFRFVLPGEPI